MTKTELRNRVDALKTDTKNALQLLYDNIPKGQQKQVVKVPEIKALFDRYGVKYESK